VCKQRFNGTFICFIEETKGLKQSFIIESEQPSCGSTSAGEAGAGLSSAGQKRKTKLQETMNNFSLTIYI
jgi:hypothetical protein